MPHDKYNIRGIAHAHTNRKDEIFMQRQLHIDKAHTALDIFRFAVFLNYVHIFVAAREIHSYEISYFPVMTQVQTLYGPICSDSIFDLKL